MACHLTEYGGSTIMVNGSSRDIKPVEWVGSSYKNFRSFPDPVQDLMGYALYQAQIGRKHRNAKPLKGFGGGSIIEIVDDHDGDTYRAVYTVKFAAAIYVLHAFQKKSKTGIKTTKDDLELVHQRLKAAEADYKSKPGAKS
jgi:phage-related protein